MRVAILTIHSYNYGNRLQNYALQKFLQSLEIDTETLQRETDKRNTWKKLKNLIGCTVKHDKISCFRWFDRKIQWSDFVIENGKKINYPENQYDYIIAGSDQIWNPYFPFNSHLDFMTFAPKEKRIAYAASFGVEEIPEEKQDDYKKWISEIPSISVREDSGSRIIERLTKKEIAVVPDPTLLIDKMEWEKVERSPKKKPKGKYLLAYFIGEYSKTTEENINRIAKQRGLSVVKILKDRGEMEGITGPAEFLWLVHHSDCVCTDSYHGSIFSIIFQKSELYVFSRSGQEKDMSSRFLTLWRMCQLKPEWKEEYHATLIAGLSEFDIKKHQKDFREIASIYLKQAMS